MRARFVNEHINIPSNCIVVDVETKLEQLMQKPNDIIDKLAKSFIGKWIYVHRMEDKDYKQHYDVIIKVKEAYGKASNHPLYSIRFLDEDDIVYKYMDGPIYIIPKKKVLSRTKKLRDTIKT